MRCRASCTGAWGNYEQDWMRRPVFGMPMSSPISGDVLQGKKSCNERKNRHTKTHQVEVAVSTASEDDAIRYEI